MADSENSTGSTPPAAPKWVKVVAIIAAIVVAVIVVVALVGGGEHGPGRHVPGGDRGLAPIQQGP